MKKFSQSDPIGELERPGKIAGRYLSILTVVLVIAGCSHSKNDGSSGNLTKDVAQPAGAAPTSSPHPTPFSLFVPSPTPTATPTLGPTPVIEPTPVVVRTEMVDAMDGLLADEAGVYGVVVMDANGNYQYARNSNLPFISASLYKLVLLADIYAKIEAGDISLSDPVRLRDEFFANGNDIEDGYFSADAVGTDITIEEAILSAGAFSSNIGADALISLTNTSRLEQMAHQIGMQNTHFLTKPQNILGWPGQLADPSDEDALEAVAFCEAQAVSGPINVTTPNDVARFFSQLIAGQVVSPEASAALIDLLAQQAVTDRLPWFMPEVTIVHKTGNLDHVVHDAGIIYSSGGPVIVAALSEGQPDDDHAAQIIQRLALIATGTYDIPPFTETATGTPISDFQTDEAPAAEDVPSEESTPEE